MGCIRKQGYGYIAVCFYGCVVMWKRDSPPNNLYLIPAAPLLAGDMISNPVYQHYAPQIKIQMRKIALTRRN